MSDELKVDAAVEARVPESQTVADQPTAPATDLAALQDVLEPAVVAPERELTAEEISEAKAEAREKRLESIVPDMWLASGKSHKNLHVRAETRELAVALACAYLSIEPTETVVAACKLRFAPLNGEPVLRANVLEDGRVIGYIRGAEPRPTK